MEKRIGVAPDMDLNPFGKLLILSGIIIVVVGVAMLFFDKLPIIGRLPGDIVIKRPGFVLYFPLGSMVVISLLLTLIFAILRRS